MRLRVSNYELRIANAAWGSGRSSSDLLRKLALILYSQFAILNYSAAVPLTLTSTNDYRFVQMPTNWTPQIVGVGCGPDDTSAAIRAEDVFFLNEAMREREFVAAALRLQATTNSQPYKTPVVYLSTPIPISSHMLELGNASTNLFSGTITSNAVGFVTAPKEIHEDPAQHFGTTSSSLDFGYFMTNFYASGKTTSSHRYFDSNVGYLKKYTLGGYPYPMIVRGVCTNLYHDLAANTFVAFIQPQRTGPSGITQTINQTTVYNNWATSFSDCDEEFYFPTGSDNEWVIPIASRYSAAYDEVMQVDISGMRSAYVGAKNGSIIKRGTGTQSIVLQERHHGTYCFTLPDPIVGSRLKDVKTAFAAVEMEVTESSYTNGYTRAIIRHVLRRGIMPIQVSPGPLDDGGCPSFTFDIDADAVLSTVMGLFDEKILSPNMLLGRCPEPDFPTNATRTFSSINNNETYSLTVRVPWIVGVSEIDFRAKQRNSQ